MLTPPQSRMLFRIPEAAELLGISRSSVYNLIAAGTLRATKIGAATRIPASELARIAEQGAVTE